MQRSLLTFLIIQFCILQANADFFGLNLDEKAPLFQCMLIKYDNVLKEKVGVCSGSYLNKNIFLTAAHCFNKLALGSNFEDNVRYIVKCKTDKKLVHAVATHPLYYVNREDIIDNFNTSIFSTGVNLKTESIFSMPYNDIALAYTDDVNITSFPTINFDQNFVPKDNSCRFLGFSPNFCEPFSGSGCYRHNFSITPAKNSGSFYCNYESKKNCYSLKSEKQSHLYFYNHEDNISSKGDSGAGVLCQNQNSNEELLTGIKTSSHEQDKILSIANRSDFILEYINLKKKDFIKKSENYKIHSKLKDNLINIRNIERSLYYRVKVETFNLLTGTEILSSLSFWIENDFSLVSSLLEETQINTILITDLISDFGLWRKIKGTKAYIKDSALYGKTLFIHPEANISNVEQAFL